MKVQKNTVSASWPLVFRAISNSARKLVSWPVAAYFSTEDAFFPSDEVKNKMKHLEVREFRRLRKETKVVTDQKERKNIVLEQSRYFPNCPLFIDAESNVSHVAAVTDPERYISDMYDLIKRMYEFNRMPRDSNHKQTEQQFSY